MWLPHKVCGQSEKRATGYKLFYIIDIGGGIKVPDTTLPKFKTLAKFTNHTGWLKALFKRS